MSDVELSEPVIECAGCNEMAGNCYMWVEVGGKTYCSSVCAKRNAPEPMPPRPAPALTPKQEAAANEMAKALTVLDSFWDFGEPVLPNTAITYENPDGINAAMIQARAARKAWDTLAKAGRP